MSKFIPCKDCPFTDCKTQSDCNYYVNKIGCRPTNKLIKKLNNEKYE